MTILLILLPISSMLIYKHRDLLGGTALFWASLAATEWTLCAFIESLPLSISHKIAFSMAEYVGLSTYPVTVLLFTLSYSGIYRRHHLRDSKLKYLFIPSILIIIAAITNPLHHLMWPKFTPGPDNTLIYHHGPFFWLFVTVFFLLALATVSTLFFVAITNKSRLKEVMTLLVTLFIPWWAGILYVTGWNPFTGYDIVSLSAGFAIICTALLIYKKKVKFIPPTIVIKNVPPHALAWVVEDSYGEMPFSSLGIPITNKEWLQTSTDQTYSVESTTLEFAGEMFVLHLQLPLKIKSCEVSTEQQLLIEKLETLFQKEKLYTNQALDLETLAMHLKTNRTYLSQAVNAQYGINLPALINKYRLEHFTLETRQTGELYSIEERAKAAGFSGKSTFYRAFKKNFQMSPLEWQQQHLNN